MSWENAFLKVIPQRKGAISKQENGNESPSEINDTTNISNGDNGYNDTQYSCNVSSLETGNSDTSENHDQTPNKTSVLPEGTVVIKLDDNTDVKSKPCKT